MHLTSTVLARVSVNAMDHSTEGQPTMPTSQTKAGTSAPPTSRRACERVDIELHVDMHSEHNFFAGFSSNISEGGIFIATHQLRPVGSHLEIEITLPSDTTTIAARALVRWIREYNDSADAESPGMGLEFVDLSDESKSRIQAFIESVRQPIFWED